LLLSLQQVAVAAAVPVVLADLEEVVDRQRDPRRAPEELPALPGKATMVAVAFVYQALTLPQAAVAAQELLALTVLMAPMAQVAAVAVVPSQEQVFSMQAAAALVHGTELPQEA
jgi:hypothetical protein